MLCSLSKDDKNYDVYKKLIVLMTAKLNEISNSKDAKINVDELMKDLYTKVLSKKQDHELALRMSRMVPSIVFNIITKDNAKIMPLMSKGLDMNRLAELSALSIDEKAGIEYMENELGLSIDLLGEAKDATLGASAPVINAEEIENPLPEAQPSGEQLSFVFNEDGTPVVVEVNKESNIEDQKADIERRRKEELLARDKREDIVKLPKTLLKKNVVIRDVIPTLKPGQIFTTIEHGNRTADNDFFASTSSTFKVIDSNTVVGLTGSALTYSLKNKDSFKGKRDIYLHEGTLETIQEINAKYDAELAALEEKPEQEIILPENKIFEAVAPHVLKDTDQEALSMDPSSPEYNVVDPTKKLFYKVKRKIVNLLRAAKATDSFNYPGVGKVFLKAVNSSLLPEDVKLKTTTPVVLVVVDKDGKPVRFDNEGNVKADGKLSFYNLRTPFEKDGAYEKKRVEAIMNSNKVSQSVAQKVIDKERQLVEDVLKYVSAKPNNSVTMDITGGTLGHLGSQKEPYFISKVAFGSNVFNPQFSESDGKKYFVMPSVSDQPIQISEASLAERPEMIELLSDFIVNDIYNQFGKKLSNKEKKAILERYVVLNSNRLTILENGAKLQNKMLDVSTPEAREAAKEQIANYFGKLSPYKVLTDSEVKSRVARGAKVVESIEGAKVGDILKSTDANQGQDVYELLTNVTLNISKAGLENKMHFSLATNADGQMVMTTIPNGYTENYIKNNFKIDKLINAENELVSLNSYLTFSPLNYETGKIDGITPESIENDVDGFTAALNQMNAAEKERYDKLPAEVKEAMAIKEQASNTLPVNGVLSQQMVLTFEQNLKAALYDREFAMKILEAMKKEVKLSDQQVQIAESNIRKNTTAPVANVQETTEEVNKAIQNVTPVSETEEIQDPLKQDPKPDSTFDKKRKSAGRKANRNRIQPDNGPDLFGQQAKEDDDETFFKLVALKSTNPKVTEEQIKAAKDWYESSPISKHFSFREMFDVVNTQNPDAIAQWTTNGIVLYKGSDFTDLYHEAFHAFSQSFMTNTQRKELYGEVRKKKGTFKSYQGRIVEFSSAKDKEIEEWLAEDFRTYMLTGRKKKTGEPKRNTFFEKLWNILDMIFGNLTIQEVRSNDKANDKIEEIYEKLRVGNLDGYNFNKANVKFNSLDKGVEALNEYNNLMNLNNKDTNLLMDSMDAWVAQIVDAANAGMPEDKYEEFSRKQIEMFVGNLSAEEMEQAKLELAPKLTYSQTALFLKTKDGRQKAYRIIQYNLASIVNRLQEEESKEKDPVRKQELRRKHSLAFWAYENFGDVNEITNNKAEKDGTLRGVIGYHMAKSKDFGTAVMELLDDNTDNDSPATKSDYADKSGNDTSLKELAKSEVVYLFKTILKYDPATGQPVLNELGAPQLMDFAEVWNKVAVILENERDAVKMYNKLLAYAQKADQDETTYAVRQLINKLGPRGLNVDSFPHLQDPAVQTLWTNFWTVFSTRRVPLISQQIELKMEENTKKVIGIDSRIGRGINPNAQVGKGWNSLFKWDRDNPYVDFEDGIPILNTDKILKKFKDAKSVIEKDQVFEFLHAIGVKLTDNEDIRRVLKEGDAELGIKGDYSIIKTLLSPTEVRLKSDPKSKSEYEKLNNDYVKRMSLLESINDAGFPITQPQDIFKEWKVEAPGGYLKTASGLKPIMMSGLSGEMANWQNLMAIESYFGQGLVSFMVTTASGTTQFEHTLNSTMSITVTSINEAKNYADLIQKPHMAHFDVSKNPNAKRYAWLRNMFKIDDAYIGTAEYGERHMAKGKQVKLDLFNISGTQKQGEEGVSSASADPFTKFILDVHLATQKGLPELMRHSDKSTSYSVALNYTTDPITGNSTPGAMYMQNTDFFNNRNTFHQQAFANYILPNLISEHARVRKMMDKKAEIDNTLKQIAKERKAGQQITPTPAYDFNYLKQGQKFIAFSGVLNSDTKTELSKIEDLEAYLNNESDPKAVALRNKLIAETENYFKGQYEEVKSLYDKAGLVADNHIKNIISEYSSIKSAGEINPTRDEVITAILNSYVYNGWIHNIESANMLYGDIAAYNHVKEEFHKRNSGIGSTGTGYRTDVDMLNHINNYRGRGFEQALTGNSRLYDGTMNTGVMKDKITRSEYLEEIAFNLYNQMKAKAMRNAKQSGKSEEQIEEEIKTKLFGKPDVDISSVDALSGIEPKSGSIMSNYYKMTEADAQGWISMDSYRILADSQGEWSKAQEAIYQAMLAGKEIDGDKIGTFFPPIKAQYWGQLKNMDENLIAFHKFQLTPITPTLAVPGSKLEKLHNKMMAQGIDYVVFQSGSKVSTITSVQFNDKGEAIRDKEGNIESIADDIYNDERQITDNDFTVNTIYVDYLKNQLKIEPKFKKNVTIPTQIRKLIMVDLMENGIPTDFQPDEELESRIEAWFNLTDAEQEAASNNYKKLRTYEKSVEKLSQIKMMQLIRKANLKLNEDGSLSGDLTNLIKFVKSQLSTQDIADHELDFIDVDLKNKSVKRDLSYSLSADKIERLLNALVVKSLVKQKAKGESLIQVASAMLEGEPQFKNPTKEELLQYGGTNGLTYYRINEAKGTIDAMKIKIAMQGDFEKLLYLPDVMVTKDKVDNAGKVLVRNGKPVKELDYNASLKKLNQLIKDDSWLDKGDNRKMVSMHGDRIPIQGLNSDEFAEVYEFLPKEAGNIIILPAEIVAKSGGDFDIDKLTLLMPNIGLSSKTIDGEVVYSVGLYKALDQKEYADRYEQYKQAFVEKYLTQGFTEDYDKFKALQLHYQLKFDVSEATGKFQIFGGSEAEVIASVIEMALEEGDLLSFDEFILADEEKVAQNEFLFALNALSSSIENYSNLVRPNGTDIFDEIVDNARSVYRDYTPKYTTNDETYSGDYGKGIQPSRVFEISYNLFKHMTNNFGKKALGIGAIDNTYNELMNRVGMYLTPNNRELLKGVESDDMAPILERARKVDELNKLKKEVDDYNKDKKGADKKQFDYNAWKQAREAYTKDDQEAVKNFVRQTLYLPHNTMRVKDSSGNWYKDRAISMSHIMDAAGENKIGDVISQMMNGWVDVAKEPWIFYVRGDEKLGPILLFLVQAGVPIRHAVNLISQPVIVEYMETISKLQSQFSEAMGNKDEDNTITRDRAILKAKEIMMSKLGYEIKGTDPNKKIQNLTQTIAEESTYVLPKVLNKDKQFDINDLEAQNKHVYDKYKMFDPKTGQPIKGNKQVDYSDPFINDYQKSVFLHFLQIVDMESSLKDVKLRTNVDTAKSGNLYEAENKILQLQELKRARQDSKTQTKYWRIPSAVIDRMIPTIKDEMGEDTGKLDRSKTGSVLSSFYVQPFQLEMWKNLFPIRNTNTINKFLTDLSFTDKDDAKRDTYFSTDEKLIGEFKSALIPMIFQNSFLGYDLDTEIKNAEGGPIYFRGIEVRLESVGALQVGAQVKYETPSDAILYYDYNSLYSQFQKSMYATDQYAKMGLSKLDANSFKSFSEYVKFVFEREYLRAQYVGTGSKKDIKKLQEDKEYKEIFRDTVRMVKRKTLADGSKESTTEWNKKRHRVAFERYIKNKALQNSHNMHAMFNGETAFAYEVASIKTDKRFEGIVDVFPVLKNLVPDTEQSKSSSTERVNLAFLDAPADSQMVNSYYEQLQDLANEVSLKKLMPNLSIDDINDIATVFRKLPIVAFLQSGMSSVGRFSLTRVIDQDTVVTMSEGAVNDFLNKINNDGPENPTLRSYWKAFVNANKKYDARGKNYVIQTDGKGTEVADITDAVFVKTDANLTGTGKVYDVAFIDDNGVPVRKFSRIGDKLKVIRTYDNVDKSSEIVIDNIEWQDNRVVITALNPTNNSTFEFQYNAEGVLTQHTQADGTVKTNPRNIRTSAVITDDLINSLTDANLNLTQPGNIVDVMFVISGNTTVSPSEVLSIEDLGFRAAQTTSGLVYENEDYYFNVKLKNAASEKLYDYVVNQRGEIVGTVNDAGNIMGKYNGNKIAMKLPQARMLGDKVVRSVAEAEALVAQGVIPPGTWVDVLEQHPKLRTTISTLGIIDPTTFKFTPVDTAYEDMDEGPEEITEEDSQFFLVYNGVVKPGASLAQEGSSATVAPGGKGKIDLRDRFIHHGLFNNKVGLTTRTSYRGGQMNEFITDDVDPVTGVASINPEVKEAIDNEIQQMLVKQEAGFKPMFNKSGYGQYMIGANDTTNEIIGDPVAKETFIYLSKQLLENFGYINPNFIAKAEGLKEIVKVTKQPVSDEQFRDMMNKCFNL